MFGFDVFAEPLSSNYSTYIHLWVYLCHVNFCFQQCYIRVYRAEDTGGHCGRKWVLCQFRHTALFWSVFQSSAYLTSFDPPPPFQFDLMQGRAGFCNSPNLAYMRFNRLLSQHWVQMHVSRGFRCGTGGDTEVCISRLVWLCACSVSAATPQ